MIEIEQIQDIISAAGVEGAAEIMNAFWRSTDDLVSGLERALNEGALAEATTIGHAIKGSASNVGAAALAAAAQRLETACRASSSTDAAAALAEIRTAAGEARMAYSDVFVAARAKAS